MAQPYQLYYRLEDFRTEERYQTSLIGGTRLDIYNDIVSQFKKGNFNKLGIQAPPGTKFYINSSTSPIMIGRTGIYELDEDINVSSLKFEAPKNYELNEGKTQEHLIEGINQTKAAKTFYDNYMTKIAGLPGNKDSQGNYTAQYWKDYNVIYKGGTLSNNENIETGYSAQMEGAYSSMIQGINGVYDVKGVKEINNVIIDFLIEEGGSN